MFSKYIQTKTYKFKFFYKLCYLVIFIIIQKKNDEIKLYNKLFLLLKTLFKSKIFTPSNNNSIKLEPKKET